MTDLCRSRPNPSPRGIPTRSATRSSTRILDGILEGGPERRVGAWRRSSPPAWSTSPARSPPVVTPRSRAIVRECHQLDRVRPSSSETGFDGHSCGVRGVDRGAVPRHRGRRRQGVRAARGRFAGPARPAGRGRPGHHVRLRDHRDAASSSRWPRGMAHRMAERPAEVAQVGELPYLRPDGKTQVTLGYEGALPAVPSRSCRAVDAASARTSPGRRCAPRVRAESSTRCSSATGLDLPDDEVATSTPPARS